MIYLNAIEVYIMQVFDLNGDFFPRTEKLILLIGFFDGVHIGHQKLIQEAKKYGSPIGVLTFSSSLIGLKEQKLLLSEKCKQQKLEDYGIRYYFRLNFDKVRKWSKELFLNHLSNINIEHIIISEDFTFGYQKTGRVRDLLDFFNKDKDIVKVISLLALPNGDKISSTYIRTLLNRGEIEEANRLLGYKYFRINKVVEGLHNGTKLGFPTANLEQENSLVDLKDGVYKTHVKFNNKLYLSMTNVGCHPTVDQLSKSIIETNIFDFDQNLYGKTITVFFDRYIRPQQKFSTLIQLKEQLEKDKLSILNIK